MTRAEARHPGIDAGISNPVMMSFSCYVLFQAPRHYPHQDSPMTARPERRPGEGTLPTESPTIARVALGHWPEAGINRQSWR